MSDDFPSDVLKNRKHLIPTMSQRRKEKKHAILKYDKHIVDDGIVSGNEKKNTETQNGEDKWKKDPKKRLPSVDASDLGTRQRTESNLSQFKKKPEAEQP